MSVQKGYRDRLNHLKMQYRIGKERRLNWTKHVLEEGTPMPKPVTLKDIDREVVRFVKEDLNISYDGEDVPTIELFSNQRISEFIQSWDNQDSNNNLKLNLKTISRGFDVKWGKMQGDKHNIPAPRRYAIYYVPTMGENGQLTYDRWSMRQPITVDLSYSLNIISNKIELINSFSTMMQKAFAGINCYVYPEGYAMPAKLEDVSDSSENSLDNRKYYQQTYKITVMAYIIEPEDLEVTKMPTRWKPSVGVIGIPLRTKDKKDDAEVTVDFSDKCETVIEHHRYTYRNVLFIMKTGMCNNTIECTYENDSESDSEFVLQGVELDNLETIEIYVNEEKVNLQGEEPIKFMVGDKIKVDYRRKDILKEGEIVLSGYDALTIIDEAAENEYETVLDAKPSESDRIIEIE